jgi:hypothetical protein
MKEPEMNPEVLQILSDFENLEAEMAPEAWNQALMQQLGASQAKQSANSALPMPYMAILLIFIGMNAVCIFNIFKNTPQPSFHRLAKLNIISTELLIPNVALNH